MISIIICSANAEELSEVSKNIDETIGVAYEIIGIDNSNGKRGICAVYNEGKQRAKFDILCFMHEDIEIKTQNWGTILLGIFSENKEIGVVGVAGGGYKALAPSGWYCVEYDSPDRSFQNVIQGYKLNDKDEIHAYHNPYQQQLSEVVCADGMWLAARKDILDEKPFDEKLLKGFHGYDVDFCLNIFGKHKIVVTYDILMKHSSEGNFGREWLESILKLHRKWNAHFPLTVTNDVDEKLIYRTEKLAIKNVIEQMLEWKFSFGEIQRMLISGAKSKRMPLRLFFKGYVHLVEQHFGLGDK
ncbi:glycosyltransferase [Dyadobacter sp. CY356]|uniref:glycosyltransferase n=1 Tax=Dyadobacter sp. CY356 TaxID=2906442 RepID=UPI001F477A8F|nr:glycosyltransferase [Dyadobacter sp. CY356]MCF0056996.1 glycosyltransferase family protein [Dyadobacter sp. CY356]